MKLHRGVAQHRWLWALAILSVLSRAGQAVGQQAGGYFYVPPKESPPPGFVDVSTLIAGHWEVDPLANIHCVPVNRVIFDGNTYIPESWLRARIAKAGPVVCLMGNGGSGTTLDVVAEDLLLHYRGHGFHDVRIERELILEDGDVAATVVFRIQEGERRLAKGMRASALGSRPECQADMFLRIADRIRSPRVELHFGQTRTFPPVEEARQILHRHLLGTGISGRSDTLTIPLSETQPEEDFKDFVTRVKETAQGGILFQCVCASDAGLIVSIVINHDPPLRGIRSLMGWVEPHLAGVVEFRYGVLKDNPTDETIALGCSEELRSEILGCVRQLHREPECVPTSGKPCQPCSFATALAVQDIQPENSVRVYFVAPGGNRRGYSSGFSRFVDRLNAGISPIF
jgi:hypothetical protein